jgi:ABC-type polysaccharide/polyol phosphate export permease
MNVRKFGRLQMTKIRWIFNFIRDIFRLRSIIIDLAKRDLKNRYLGSYLGIFWAFIQPIFSVLIMVYVFGYSSLKGGVDPNIKVPFVVWLMSGMIPWFFISDSISSGSGSIIENSFLVKKVVFRVGILPIVKLISSFFIHCFFIIVLFLICVLFGILPNICWIGVIYYLFAAFFLLLGISWITSSIVIFFRDLSQIIGVVIQLLFWLTPIFWSVDKIGAKTRPLLGLIIELNPFYYIISGYRNVVLYNKIFVNNPLKTIYFWSFSVCVFLIGIYIFKKLRPHFADVI